MTYPPVHKLFEEAAARFPARTAVREAALKISYQELNQKAESLAAELQANALFKEGSRVALRFRPGIDYISSMLAVLKAGGVFVPLDPSLPEKRRQLLVDKVKPVAFLDSAGIEWTGRSDALGCDSDACYVVFTSGSTGEPKAILGSHRGLSHFVQWEITEFGLDESVRISQLAPPTFDVSLRDIFVPLSTGGVVCVPSAKPAPG